jgi:hypothetical protein
MTKSGAACLALLGATALTTGIAGADATRVYAVVFQVEDAASATVTRETLGVENAQGHTYVRLANANGATAGFTATLAPDGEIENEPHEVALICYNMATSLIAQHARTPKGPLSLVVLVDGRPAAVQLGLRPGGANASDIVATGRYASAVVNARIATDGGLPTNAAFEEVALSGSPARVRSRTMCAFTDALPGTPPVGHPLERS